MIADQILAAIPPIEPRADDPDYVARIQDLFEHHAAARTVPLTEDERG